MGLPDFPWTTGPRDYDLPDEVLDAHGSPIATGAEYGGCSSDPFGYPYVVYEPGVAAFIVSCVRAIETAAAKLGMDPATLAERCANGEIGTLAIESRHYCYASEDDDEARNDLDAALQPFTKEQPCPP